MMWFAGDKFIAHMSFSLGDGKGCLFQSEITYTYALMHSNII